jgi:hypothetical protein
MVYSTTADNHYQAIGSAPSFRFADTITSPTYTGIIGLATATNNFITGAVAGDMVLSNNTSSAGNFLFGTGATERMRINASTGNISINSTNNTYKFDVTGTSRFSGQLRLESTITDGTYTYTLPSATGTLALTSQLTGGTVTSVGLSSATSGVTIGSTPITTSGTITLAIATASSSQQGLLSSTDWTTFNNKQSALTNPVTGTGTTNYLPKFTGASTIGNSLVYDNGSGVGINTTSISAVLDVNTAGSSIRFGDKATVSNDINVYYRTTGIARNDIGGGGTFTWGISGSSELMRLNASGNLSLGNTNDTYKLDVTGTGRFSAAVQINSNTTGLILNRNAVTNYNGIGYWTAGVGQWFVGMRENLSSNNYIIYNEALGTDVLTLSVSTGAATFSGKVGVGGASATYTLTAYNSTNGTTAAFGGTARGLRIDNDGTFSSGRTTIFGVDSSFYGSYQPLAINGSFLYFGVAGNDNMVINASGNVGIGTTTPGSKLSIVGLPTSSAGLSSGDIYVAAGVLMIV